jgi:DNA polymerase-4
MNRYSENHSSLFGDQRAIIHVDMDAFYSSVEQIDNPALRDQPVIVGGSARGRGVVSAASYEARKYGVHSAMPMSAAIRLCPNAVVLPVRMGRYADLSGEIHDVFAKYTPIVEPLSLDEAFLDVTGSQPSMGDAEQIGWSIKREIKNKTKLTASVGIAPNKFLAKLASDLRKPDGFLRISDSNLRETIDPLPVCRMWGIGKATESLLHKSGIATFQNLRECSIPQLETILGNQAFHIIRLAEGIDERSVHPFSKQKSISSEQTFSRDTSDRDALRCVLLNQVQDVACRIRRHRFQAGTATVKLRLHDFRTITRSAKLAPPTDLTESLWQSARHLFLTWSEKQLAPLRLIGFSASHFVHVERGRQLSLFPDEETIRLEKVDRAMDQVNLKFGTGSLRRNHPAKPKFDK